MEWRFARSWSDAEIARRLSVLQQTHSEAPWETPGREWSEYYSEAAVARERPGPPGETFGRAKRLVQNFEFSDPRIVTGHFRVSDRLLGRRMLVEIRVLGLHFINGVVVTAVREEETSAKTVFGYRYDTMPGHIENGCEWFLLTKDEQTGKIHFCIQACWRPGDLPTWWSRTGFRLLARRYQRAWHRLAYLRLRSFLGATGLAPLPSGNAILHEGMPMHGFRISHVASAPSTQVDIVIERDIAHPHHE